MQFYCKTFHESMLLCWHIHKNGKTCNESCIWAQIIEMSLILRVLGPKLLHKKYHMDPKSEALDGIFCNWPFFIPLCERIPKMYIWDLRIFFRYFRLLDTPWWLLKETLEILTINFQTLVYLGSLFMLFSSNVFWSWCFLQE